MYGLGTTLLSRNNAVEEGGDKRKDAENAERRRGLAFQKDSQNGVRKTPVSTPRFSAFSASLRLLGLFSSAWIRLRASLKMRFGVKTRFGRSAPVFGRSNVALRRTVEKLGALARWT